MARRRVLPRRARAGRAPRDGARARALPPARDGDRAEAAAGVPAAGSALWPKPHNALFDFEATAAGAEWIDDIGAAARRVADRPVGAEVVGHTDWSAKHLRFDAQLRATALYDWDSVTTGREPGLVGTAAGSFTYTEELDVDVWPSAAESQAFLAEYEEARGTPFTRDERAVAQAACVYLRAYAARCHHAFGGDARETGLVEVADALLSPAS